MKHSLVLLLCLVIVLLVPSAEPLGARGESPGDGDSEIPVVDRPSDLPFSGASGRQFKVEARVEPTTVEVESSLTLTVRVEGLKDVRRPPQRIHLQELSEFAEAFYLQDPPGKATTHPEPRVWEFRYTLKPRTTSVVEVPGVPFVYYDPFSRRFQIDFTLPIPVKVTERQVHAVPLQGPEAAFELVHGATVLSRVEPASTLNLTSVVVWLLAPPGICLLWYLGWRIRYPDAARLAALRSRQRQSRAGRRALDALERLENSNHAAVADAVKAIANRYLGDVFGRTPHEPTPQETALHLARSGLSPQVVEHTRLFFRRCDELRFAPHQLQGPDAGAELKGSAFEWILAVESEREGHHGGSRKGDPDKVEGERWELPASLAVVVLVGFLMGSATNSNQSAMESLSDQEVLSKAEAAFAAGVQSRAAQDQARPHFRQAAQYFGVLQQRGVHNPALYHNLGNAHLLEGNLPAAILAYRQGLRLAPPGLLAGELQHLLDSARQEVVGPAREDPPPHRSQAWVKLFGLSWFSPGWFSWSALLSYALGWLLFTRWRMRRRRKYLALGILAFVVSALLASVMMWGWQVRQSTTKTGGFRAFSPARPVIVIREDGVILRRGDSLAFPPRQSSPLNRGREGYLLFERSGWLKVQLSDGETGWVPAEYVLVERSP